VTSMLVPAPVQAQLAFDFAAVADLVFITPLPYR